MIPFVNFMVTLVPILIMSVEFNKVSIIDLKLPEGRGSQTAAKQTVPTQEDESAKLLLTAIITDSVITLGAKNGFLPSIFYQEFHHYIAKDDRSELTVRFNPADKEPPKHPKNGRPLLIYERDEIYLYATDENFSAILQGLYDKKGHLLTNQTGDILNSCKPGDTLYTVTTPRNMILVSNPAEFLTHNVSVYDQLKSRLLQIKERFGADVDDGSDIIIAAENEVLYDKIVQLMDVARSADFPNISIAKLRS
ncbi:MAG: biopolymer transporter ExbD [Chitinivibrionales bacterium]|nr:biopolymer transporter ExbD [Chitinivibrionales bacterium]